MRPARVTGARLDKALISPKPVDILHFIRVNLKFKVNAILERTRPPGPRYSTELRLVFADRIINLGTRRSDGRVCSQFANTRTGYIGSDKIMLVNILYSVFQNNCSLSR